MFISAVNLKYKRPGITLLNFTANYPKYKRRGTILFDNVSDTFKTHTSNIELLSKVCVFMQKPKRKSVN